MSHPFCYVSIPIGNVSNTPGLLILRFPRPMHLSSLCISPQVFTFNVVISNNCNPSITSILSLLLSDYHPKSFQLTLSTLHFQQRSSQWVLQQIDPRTCPSDSTHVSLPFFPRLEFMVHHCNHFQILCHYFFSFLAKSHT